MLGGVYLLLLNGAILTGCAFFIETQQQLLLVALMLFLPLLDKDFRQLKIESAKVPIMLWLVISSLIGLLIFIDRSQTTILASIILFVALPEEWFFRRYFQQKVQMLLIEYHYINKCLTARWVSNLMASFFFALLHLPSQGVLGLSVFIPSVFLGWVYTLKRDLVLVILLHSLFNVFFLVFIKPVVFDYPK